MMRQYPEALKACDESLRLSHQPDEAYFLRGVIQIERRIFRDAEASLRQAVNLNPGVASYHAAIGVAVFEEGNLAESRQELDKALTLDAHATPAYLWRARLKVREGENAQALADYETYTALAPDTARAFQEEETLYRQAGQTGKASAAHTKYIALKAEKSEAERDPSFLDQLWLARLREGLGQVAATP